MKKIYYKVTVRLYEWIDKVANQDIYSRYLYNEGYVIIKNDHFVGFLGLDFLEGRYKENTLAIEMVEYSHCVEWLYVFSEVIGDFYLPNKFLLKSDSPNEGKVCELTFEEIIKDKDKQLEIEKDYATICQLHGITTE